MDYQDFAIGLAHEAGRIMRDNFTLRMSREWKSDATPLTVTDTTVNALVVDAVKQHFPDHSVIAEEGGHRVKGSRYAWVRDPVDGTMPFSHGVPTFTFSLALVDDGVPVLGVVYDPMLDRLYVGERGKGATVNGVPMRVSNIELLDHHAIISVEFKRTYPCFGVIRELVESNACVLRYCSVIITGMLVASGEFAGVIFPCQNPWDMAAVKVIVEEAGGRVTSLTGTEQRYDEVCNGMIVSNGILHHTLLDIVRRNPVA